MDKKAELKYFCDVIEDLIKSYPFMHYFFLNPSYEVADLVTESLFKKIKNEKKIRLEWGASRFVLVPENYNYVVKIEFIENNQNFCEKEIDIYAAAKRRGIERCFSEGSFLGTFQKNIKGYSYLDIKREFNNSDDDVADIFKRLKEEKCKKRDCFFDIELYIFEKADETVADRKTKQKDSFSQESKNIIKNTFSPLSDRNEIIGLEVAEQVGEETFIKLSDLLYEWGANDFHSSNVGYIGNRIVLIDYCGYEESSS